MGWAKCKLSDVCQFESGFAFKSESYKKEGVPLIRISNIKDGTITTDGGVCIQEVVESRFHVVKGDLLIALSGATTGKMGVYDKDDEALLNQRVGNLRVISKTCFLPEYRNLFMESQTATILEQAWGGAQPNISPNTIIGFDILLPPYAEQCRIVCKANELLALVSNIEFVQDQIETGVDDIKTKVLDLAIHGKLVSQDPSDEPAINLLRRINPDFVPSDNLHYDEEPIDGWVLVPFKEVFDSIPSKPYQIALSEVKDNGRFPVISQGAKDIDGYSDDIERVFRTSVPVYVFGDHTKVLKYVPHDFIVGADGVKILKPRWDSKYLFYNLLYCVSNMENRGYSRNYQYLSSSVLHIPPVAEQNRIVSAIELLFKELDSISIVTT